MLVSRRGFRAFTEYDLGATLDNHLKSVHKQIESDPRVSQMSEEEYVKQKVSEELVKELVLDTDNITVTQREEDIDARLFPNSFMIDEGRSFPKPVITFHIPFAGDKDLLHCRPSTMLMVSEEVLVENSNILFDVINFSNDADAVAKSRDESVRHITEMAGYVNRDLAAHNARLEGFVRDAVRSAKTKSQDNSDFMSKLGNKPKNG